MCERPCDNDNQQVYWILYSKREKDSIYKIIPKFSKLKHTSTVNNQCILLMYKTTKDTVHNRVIHNPNKCRLQNTVKTVGELR